MKSKQEPEKRKRLTSREFPRGKIIIHIMSAGKCREEMKFEASEMENLLGNRTFVTVL